MNDLTTSCPACRMEVHAQARRCPHCTTHFRQGQPLYRAGEGKVLAGVCSALATRLGWDPVLVRVLAVAGLFVAGPVMIWAYLVLWVLTPFDERLAAPAVRLTSWLSGTLSAPRSIDPVPPNDTLAR